MDRYVCAICSRSFPADVMYSYSPGGLVRIHECPECHDRGVNRVDERRMVRARFVREKRQERVS